jgi:hypothetical protein
MTAATLTAPSLSTIEAWSTTHLESAAMYWTGTANAWEQAFTVVHREALAPGGTTWLGKAADAAAFRTGTDQAVVNRAADILQAAAKAARSGVDDIIAARQLVLRTIDDARAAGFAVSEDLSVRSHQVGGTPALQAARRAQAEMLAMEIRTRAEKLVGVGAEVGRSVTSIIECLSGAVFDEVPLEKPVIQAVDYAPVPESPIPDPGLPGDPVGRGAGPTGAEIWSVIDKLPQGNKHWIREVRSPQDLQRFWEWMKQDGIERKNSYKGSGKGVEFDLVDGSRIGQRFVAGSTRQPALDIDIPGQQHIKVHINPRGGVPEIPSVPKLQAEASRPLLPAESPLARGGTGVPGHGLGGGVLPDNTLPHFIEPPQTKQNPVIGDGRPDPEP